MSTGILLGIAVGAILVLLLLVIQLKMSAFVAMLLVSLGTALVTGIAPEEVVGTLQKGMGNTLGSVMIVVGLGAMLGRIIETAGGADALALAFTKKLGAKRVIGAVVAAAFVLGIPVFFDVAFIILAPIVFGFARIAGINPMRIGLPVAGVLLTVHVAMPPHPGPVAAAGITGADTGMMILVGLPICAATAFIGHFAAKLIDVEKYELGDSPASAHIGSVGSAGFEGALAVGRKAIPAGLVVLLILLPIVQIMGGTVSNMLLADGPTRKWMGLIGSSLVALLVAVIVASIAVGHHQGCNAREAWLRPRLGAPGRRRHRLRHRRGRRLRLGPRCLGHRRCSVDLARRDAHAVDPRGIPHQRRAPRLAGLGDRRDPHHRGPPRPADRRCGLLAPPDDARHPRHRLRRSGTLAHQ